MARHQLIDNYLADLDGHLPADIVDELSDGLVETWHHHLGEGLSPDEAAHRAVVEFGPPDQVVRAFVADAPGRRIALMLLASGPMVGACWGASLFAARAMTWVPFAARAGFALVLLTVVLLLSAAATSRHNYGRARLGLVGAIGVLSLDAVVAIAAPLLTPVVVWPMALAIALSLARIGITARAMNRLRVTR